MPRSSPTQNADELAGFAATQANVVSRAQLRAAGFDYGAVHRRVASGHWQRLGHAIVLHSGPVSAEQWRWAAVLTAGYPSALAGITAAGEYGLDGFESETIHVLVPYGAHPPRMRGVARHRSTRFGESDVRQWKGPPVVSRGRAIADAACWTPNPRVACGIAAAAVRQRIVNVGMIRTELLATPKARHRALLLPILGDIEGGAQSLSEIDFTDLARRAGLPPPIRQSVRLDSSGRKRYLDVDFGCFVVEVDGGLHLRAHTYWADARRQNDLVIGGDRVLRFPSIAIRLEPEVVIAQLRAAWARFSLAA